MEYKILESTGVEITHVDGAAFNNFSSGGKSGILPEVLDECRAIALTSDTVQISTGELLIKGFRVKITSPYTITKPSNIVDTEYFLIAKLILGSTGLVSFRIEARQNSTLTQEDLFKFGFGTYEIELCRFVVGSSGISNFSQTAQIISGGTATPEWDGSYTITGGG